MNLSRILSMFKRKTADLPKKISPWNIRRCLPRHQKSPSFHLRIFRPGKPRTSKKGFGQSVNLKSRRHLQSCSIPSSDLVLAAILSIWTTPRNTASRIRKGPPMTGTEKD